jgi:hypothetical protein
VPDFSNERGALGKKAAANHPSRRGTPASAAHRGIRVDPSQGTLEKIQLRELSADHSFQSCNFGFQFFDPSVPPVRL